MAQVRTELQVAKRRSSVEKLSEDIREIVKETETIKASIRSKVEHVFAHQKGLIGAVVRTIGLARARGKIRLVNLAYRCPFAPALGPAAT